VSHLFLWSAVRGEWLDCPAEEITWLDRALLSGNEDLTLHRAPRCPGLRYLNHHWELFSRDTTHRVYLAPDGPSLSPEAVRQSASHVLPVAPARYEALPVPMEAGSWLISVGTWVVRVRHERTEQTAAVPSLDHNDVTTRESEQMRRGAPKPEEDSAGRVRAWFKRNDRARLAMAFYYQDFIRGLPAPQPVPMMDVVVALDLNGEGTVSDYKKLLQSLIWSERGHARDLAGYLIGNDLLTPADLDDALRAAYVNEREGISERARQRLKYRPKG
jgi:hypothetical protein